MSAKRGEMSSVREVVGEFTRVVEFVPGYDLRHRDPAKNYGVHGMDLRFVLIGALGATQFVVFTGLYPKHVLEEWKSKGHFPMPMGADIGYHSPHAMYAGQSSNDGCAYLDGRPCYCDGSGLAADEFLPTFLTEGVNAVWAKLERVYHARFTDGEGR